MKRPSHMSNGQLNDWLRCGKSYQLKRIQGAPSKPSVFLVAGVAVHAAIYEVNLHHMGLRDEVDPSKEFEKSFEVETGKLVESSGRPPSDWKTAGRVTKDKPNKEDMAWWRVEGARQVVEYQKWLSETDWHLYTHDEKLMCEFETHADFGGTPVKGFLDAIMVSPDGELCVIDYKTGLSKPTGGAQLGLYCAAMQRVLGIEVRHGAYFMTRKAEMTDVIDLSRFSPTYFDNIFGQADKALDAGIYIPNPGTACFMCDVSDYCYAYGGGLAWTTDPDHPQYNTKKKG